jgi:hypothetical protein
MVWNFRSHPWANSTHELAKQGTLIDPCRINVFTKNEHGYVVCPGVWTHPGKDPLVNYFRTMNRRVRSLCERSRKKSESQLDLLRGT